MKEQFDNCRPSACLALVRMLLPCALWQYWRARQMMTVGSGLPAPWLSVVPAIASITMALGIQAKASSMVLAVFCTLAMHVSSMFHHHHWNCICLLLSLLAFTPCGVLYSVNPRCIIRSMRSWQEWVPAALRSSGDDIQEVAAPGEDLKGSQVDLSHWAKPLITLHMGLIYFWAGCDHLRPEWIDGSVLHGLIMKRSAYGVAPIFTTLFHSQHVQQLVCAVATSGCILVELSVPFFLWSKRFKLHALGAAFMLHVGMQILVGLQGPYTAVSWLCLIAIADCEAINEYLYDSRNFAIAFLSCLLAFSWAFQVGTSNILVLGYAHRYEDEAMFLEIG